MATRYLGDTFDIHGGGLDLRFPHHENELAQSAAAGHGFAQYWLHNGLVNTGGQKMSKSLGNSLFAADLLRAARPIVLRYFLGSAHYRSVLEFSESSLAEAAAAFGRIEGFLTRAVEAVERVQPQALVFDTVTATQVPEAFAQAMCDDFAIPQALAVVHDTVRAGNTALDRDDVAATQQALHDALAMLQVLGLNPYDAAWRATASADARAETALDVLVAALIAERRAARANKDFATSDAIRDRLQAAGITLEDGPDETRWSMT